MTAALTASVIIAVFAAIVLGSGIERARRGDQVLGIVIPAAVSVVAGVYGVGAAVSVLVERGSW